MGDQTLSAHGLKLKPFYLVQATTEGRIDPPTSFVHETNLDRESDASGIVHALVTGQHDIFEIEAIWRVDPAAGTCTNASVEILAAYVDYVERWNDEVHPLIAEALDRYGIPYVRVLEAA